MTGELEHRREDDVIRWSRDYRIRTDGAVILSEDVLRSVGGKPGDKVKIESNRTRRTISILLPTIEKKAPSVPARTEADATQPPVSGQGRAGAGIGRRK